MSHNGPGPSEDGADTTESAPDGASSEAEPHEGERNVRRRRLSWRNVGMVLGGLATLGALIIAALSLARDVTNFTTEAGSQAQTTSALPQTSPPVLVETQVIYERPWDSSGQLGPSFKVTDRLSAECRASDLSGDPETLKCFGEDSIYDTCWPNASLDSAVCLGDPWDQQVVLVEPVRIDEQSVSEKQAEPVGPTATPWALELSNGQQCTYRSGATGVVAGMRVNYFCGDESTAAIGELNKERQPWRILFSSPGVSQVVYVDIVRVWV